MGAIKAIFFDQDGVIIDTERDGHRVAFNQAFHEFGLDCEWGVERYGELLRISGGKERLRHFFRQPDAASCSGPAGVDEDFIFKLHQRKTAIFIGRVESGRLPLRPGVHRLMNAAMRSGIKLGICTTSDARAADVIAGRMLADIRFDVVLAGDIVSRKKPAPDIYLLALEKTGLKPTECVVIEDSANGVRAAKSAGMHVVATASAYTREENLGEADIVVSCLGDPGGETAKLISTHRPFAFQGWIDMDMLQRHFSSPALC
jgi:HAD superfamily hydrolase (TIGR01509 family)